MRQALLDAAGLVVVVMTVTGPGQDAAGAPRR
jgi:hypothetical protein